jgi:PAS domain S-box-containing protein
MIDAAHTMTPGLQKLLESTVELSQELLLETNLDGTLRHISPAWTHVLGWNEAELRTKTFWDLVHPDDLERTREEVLRAAGREMTSTFDIRYRHKDGSYRWISWQVVARGSILHSAGLDKTAEKHATTALRESQESTASMTRGVAHDFNNLMQNIVAALELVRKLNASGRSGETERFIVSAINSAQRAAAINQQLQGSPSDMPSNSDDG